MFNSMLYAVKRRLIDEVEGAFQNHPAFDQKVKVYNKYPYDERVQYGVVLRNTSASQIRLSADNFVSDLYSHARLVREANYPGLSIEWVRENPEDVTHWMYNEDVSSQLDSTQRMFRTSYPILAGPGNTQFATNVGQVNITINGVPELAEYINGERGIIMLRRAPASSDQVLISYYYRVIVPAGIYVIDFIDDNNGNGPYEFLIAPIYIIKKEVVIDTTTGVEITASLDNQNIYPGSERIYIEYRNTNNPTTLVRGTDYTINNTTGLITFLLTLLPGYQLLADYRWQPLNYPNGPYQINVYQENHTLIPGVVMAVGRRAKKGDRQAIIVSQFREQQARIYGGHWTMSLELAVIAKDPIQMEEMTDQVVNWLWGIRKNTLEFEGITLNSVEPSGETEEVYMETTGDMYYESSVAISLQSEWQAFVPYLYEIKEVIPNIQVWPGTKEYTISSDYKIVSMQSDPRPVIQYPSKGYERLTGPGL